METRATVICIGNEILLGHINNTNAQYISKNLSDAGIKTAIHLSVPDDHREIISSIKNSFIDSNIVILTGGLGPTVDDITLACIGEALQRKLIFKKKVADHIKAHFKKRKLKMPKNNLRQAFIPKGAKVIPNYIGSAPGLIIPVNEKILVALPGVPFEMHPMLNEKAIPFLKKIFCPDKKITSRIIKITGLAESKVNEKIEDILNMTGSVQMGIYPHPEEITVKITVTDKTKKETEATIKRIEKKIKSRLKDYIFGYDDETLEGLVSKKILKLKKTLSVAESCTGGLLSDRITDVPGSSKYFRLGLVTYSNDSKNKILGIPMEMIKKYGSVSQKVASLMAKNVRLFGKSDIGIGISGIAGPGGATKSKPVGLVYIALSTQKKTICKACHFLGQRNIIKYKSTQKALDMLRLSL
ncbi:competence/damage-inducible protein A [Candidatus Omnitrophota bacterium]